MRPLTKLRSLETESKANAMEMVVLPFRRESRRDRRQQIGRESDFVERTGVEFDGEKESWTCLAGALSDETE